MPLGVVVAVGGDAKARDLLALLGDADLGSVPEVADQFCTIERFHFLAPC